MDRILGEMHRILDAPSSELGSASPASDLSDVNRRFSQMVEDLARTTDEGWSTEEESSDEESSNWETSDDDSETSSNLYAGLAYDSYSSPGSERGFHSLGGYTFFNDFQLPDGMGPWNF